MKLGNSSKKLKGKSWEKSYEKVVENGDKLLWINNDDDGWWW